mmetsp:Transcript_10064/g.24635  ORF Transcript_10064/g.24635 Transcript_10064/m.24635 type:complete len:564 (-) Transcript_10064:1321-3012(-)
MLLFFLLLLSLLLLARFRLSVPHGCRRPIRHDVVLVSRHHLVLAQGRREVDQRQVLKFSAHRGAALAWRMRCVVVVIVVIIALHEFPMRCRRLFDLFLLLLPGPGRVTLLRFAPAVELYRTEPARHRRCIGLRRILGLILRIAAVGSLQEPAGGRGRRAEVEWIALPLLLRLEGLICQCPHSRARCRISPCGRSDLFHSGKPPSSSALDGGRIARNHLLPRETDALHASLHISLPVEPPSLLRQEPKRVPVHVRLPLFDGYGRWRTLRELPLLCLCADGFHGLGRQQVGQRGGRSAAFGRDGRRRARQGSDVCGEADDAQQKLTGRERPFPHLNVGRLGVDFEILHQRPRASVQLLVGALKSSHSHAVPGVRVALARRREHLHRILDEHGLRVIGEGVHPRGIVRRGRGLYQRVVRTRGGCVVAERIRAVVVVLPQRLGNQVRVLSRDPRCRGQHLGHNVTPAAATVVVIPSLDSRSATYQHLQTPPHRVRPHGEHPPRDVHPLRRDALPPTLGAAHPRERRQDVDVPGKVVDEAVLVGRAHGHDLADEVAPVGSGRGIDVAQ